MKAATDAERREALRVAADLLRSVHPKHVVEGLVNIGPNSVQMRATVDPAGVVRAVCKHTGQLLAQSLPARFEALDCTMLASMQQDEAAEAFEYFIRTLDDAEALRKIADFAESPQAARMTVAELAYVLREWAQRFEDAGA